MQIPSELQLTAEAPETAAAQAQVIGVPGITQYFYWVVTHFPIGAVVGGPFVVRDAPNTLSAQAFVRLVWAAQPAALGYDVLRTATKAFPAAPGNFALAVGITALTIDDQGQALQAYNPTGLPNGAPARCRITLNNRNFDKPTIVIGACQVRLSNIVFPDGSEQSTAGGGGSPGPPGPPGPQGPQGPEGPTGATGPAGPKGATGATGATGPQGALGPAGPQGPTGATGAAGATGPAGPAGPIGPEGPAGPQGPTGPQGPAGTGVTIKGSVPSSADLPASGNTEGDAWITQDTGHLWVWDGTQWVDAGLIQGPPGPAGPQGATGPQGPAGAAGGTGATGAQGPQGATGPSGPQGPQGDTGPQGPQGATGPPGPAGPTGATGPQGPAGPTGPAADLSNLIAGSGIVLTPNAGPPQTVTISSQLYSLQENVNANGFSITGAANIGTNCVVLGVAPTGPMYICLDANGNIQISDRNVTGRVWITQAGNVGIGISNPAAPLVVNGQIEIANAVQQNSLNIIGAVATTDSGVTIGNTAANGRGWSLLSSGGATVLGQGNFTIFDASGGVARVTVTPSGNVGIQTTTPQCVLDVNGAIRSIGAGSVSGGVGPILFYNAGQGTLQVLNYSTGVFQALTIQSNPLIINTASGTGNVGIGTNAPTARLTVVATTAPVISVTGSAPGLLIQGQNTNAGAATLIGLINDSNRTLQLGVYGSGIPSGQANTVVMDLDGMPMEITNVFGVGIGVMPTFQFQLGADSAAKPGTNTWTIASDDRTKTNIQPLEGGMSIVLQVVPQVAQYNGSAGTPNGMRVVSVSAQAMQAILPDSVTATPMLLNADDTATTDVLAYNTHELFYHMVLALQQVDARLKAGNL